MASPAPIITMRFYKSYFTFQRDSQKYSKQTLKSIKKLKFIPKWYQPLERNHLMWRSRIKRLARKAICFSKSIVMYNMVIGLFINYYEFGRTVQQNHHTLLLIKKYYYLKLKYITPISKHHSWVVFLLIFSQIFI